MGLRLLKSKRALKGFTQEQLATKKGINTKTYNLKENGKFSFLLLEASIISQFLELSLEEVNDIFLQIELPKSNYNRGK